MDQLRDLENSLVKVQYRSHYVASEFLRAKTAAASKLALSLLCLGLEEHVNIRFASRESNASAPSTQEYTSALRTWYNRSMSLL